MEDDQRQELDVKGAVRRAHQIMYELFDESQLRDLLLEEIERSGDTWLVTMGFTRPGRGMPIGAIMAPPMRAFKRLKIDARTGEFDGMEIRQLPAPPPDRLT